MRTIHLTQSQAKCYLSCRRKYFLEYEECLKPRQEAEALEIGKSYHACISSNEGSSDPKINAMYQAYKKYIDCDILEHEKEFSLHLGYGVYYHGKVDGMCEDGSIVEHKTAGIIDDKYFFRLQADIQISLYMLANNTNKCLYTVVQKPTIRLKQNEEEEAFADRLIHWYDDAVLNEKKVFRKTEIRTKSHLEEAKKEFLQIGREIRSNKIYPRNIMHCSIVGCPYQPLCLDYDPVLADDLYYKKDRINEELEF